LILRHAVKHLSEQNCDLRSEVIASEYVCQQLMRKNKQLRQAMIIQAEMIHEKDFVACKLA